LFAQTHPQSHSCRYPSCDNSHPVLLLAYIDLPSSPWTGINISINIIIHRMCLIITIMILSSDFASGIIIIRSLCFRYDNIFGGLSLGYT
jgi:hypothetical protein